MKPTLLKRTLLTACLAISGLAAVGGPLQRADLPADPSWVIHADFDGLRPTAIGQFILAEMDKPEAQAKLALFQSLFSFDLRTQLHGVTLYSSGDAAEDGVLLVYADVDPQKLISLAQAANDYQTSNYNQHVIHTWIDNKRIGNTEKPRTYAAIQGTGLIVFGQREAAVTGALDVLDRAKPNLANSKAFPQLGIAGSGNFIEAVAGKVSLPGSDAHAAMFRLAKSMRFQVGEVQRKVTATLSLEAKDDEVAGHMAGVGQGLIALLKLQKEKAEVVKFAEALSLKQDGSSVVASFTMSADDILALVRSHIAEPAKEAQ